ncbi:hypothetical protein BTVI_108637 [Pitangus sulphuratus]|nr:hypothetical protein BTVI_108637 [Pitangus sulphuratus]
MTASGETLKRETRGLCVPEDPAASLNHCIPIQADHSNHAGGKLYTSTKGFIVFSRPGATGRNYALKLQSQAWEKDKPELSPQEAEDWGLTWTKMKILSTCTAKCSLQAAEEAVYSSGPSYIRDDTVNYTPPISYEQGSRSTPSKPAITPVPLLPKCENSCLEGGQGKECATPPGKEEQPSLQGHWWESQQAASAGSSVVKATGASKEPRTLIPDSNDTSAQRMQHGNGQTLAASPDQNLKAQIIHVSPYPLGMKPKHNFSDNKMDRFEGKNQWKVLTGN